MAYEVDFSAYHDDQTLIFNEFEGGDASLRFDMQVDGMLVRGMSIKHCLMFNSPVRVPSELMPAMPTRITINPREGYLPDFGTGPWGGLFLVSQNFVDIVEWLEPGVHQFLQIRETFDVEGRQLEKRYYLMNILRVVNAVDVERSSVRITRKDHFLTLPGRTKKVTTEIMGFLPGKRVLVFRKGVIEGLHLWRGTMKDLVGIGFSEALHDAVQAANLSPLRYTHAAEV
jgi:hypothetical protein